MGNRPERQAGPALLTILLGAVGAGPMLTFGLNATSDRVIGDLGIDELQFGLIATVCFACAAVGNAVFGGIADRRSGLFLMTLIFLLAASALLLVAVPAGFWLLLVSAGLCGIAQSFPNGVTNRILLDRVPGARRIAWVGVKQSGVQASQLVASLTFPLLALAAGWRGAAAISSLLPLLLLAMTWRTLRAVPLLPEVQARDKAPSSTPEAPKRARVKQPGLVWAMAVFGLLNGVGVQATNVYMPLFAVRELDFSLVLGGATAAVAGFVGVTARVGWARVMAAGASGPKLLVVLGLVAMAGAGCFYGAWATGSAALLWTAVALHGASALGVSVVLMSALMHAIPSASMASASGMATAGMFAGFTLGPVGMGALVNSPGGFPAGWIAVGVMYLLCVVLAAVLLRRAGRA